MRNHEAKLAAQRRWYRNNREKVLAWQKDYHVATRDARLAKTREYNARPEVKERARQRYAANREAVRAQQMAYDRTPMARFKSGRKGAERRGLTWHLTFGQYLGVVACNRCHYCAGPLSEAGLGLDRIDHGKGYEPGNILPCCGDCNARRQDTWTVDEMLAAANAVRELRRIRNG